MSINPLLTFRSNGNKDKNSKPLSFEINWENLMQNHGEELAQRDAFIRKSVTIDVVRLNNLNIKNFRLVDSRSVRGQSLTKKPVSLLEELKSCGIETVVDLRREGSSESSYAKKCEQAGMRYMHFQVNTSMPQFNSRGSNKVDSRVFATMMDDFTLQLADFFDEMSNGRVYVGCLLGLHRTDLAVSMNYLLNPVEPESPPFLSHMFFKNEPNATGTYIGAVKNLLKNLSSEQRSKLGLLGNFEDILGVRVAKLRLMNKFL